MAQAPPRDSEKRTLIRRNLQRRRQQAQEEQEQERYCEQQAQVLAQQIFVDEERRVHLMLASEARWFLAALCVTLGVAALASSWETVHQWTTDFLAS